MPYILRGKSAKNVQILYEILNGIKFLGEVVRKALLMSGFT